MFTPSDDRVRPADIRRMAFHEDAPYPILTVVGMYDLSLSQAAFFPLKSFAERRDAYSASERNRLRIHDEIHEAQVAYLKGLLTHAWNWVALPFSPMPSNPVTSISRHHESISIPPKDHQPEDAGSVSTCVPNKTNSFGLVHRQQTAKAGNLEL